MKKTLLLIILYVFAIAKCIAQPTLTAANSNPTSGEIFYGHTIDTSGKNVGSSGAGVTWIIPTEPILTIDTTIYSNCISTPYCDSFPTSNLAALNNLDYTYSFAYTGGLSMIGMHTEGQLLYFTDPLKKIAYPFTFGSISHDTAFCTINTFTTIYLSIYYSITADAWGTLITPSGTYSNTLRTHTTIITKDSLNLGGMPIINYLQNEEYNWYNPGVHHPLLTMSVDTIGSGSTYLSGVKYYTQHLSPTIVYDKEQIKATLYPNPAQNMINVRWSGAGKETVEISITDLTGRLLKKETSPNLKNEINNIDLPCIDYKSGTYILYIRSGENLLVEKFTIEH